MHILQSFWLSSLAAQKDSWEPFRNIMALRDDNRNFPSFIYLDHSACIAESNNVL